MENAEKVKGFFALAPVGGENPNHPLTGQND
jgi:hypothetical protein